MGLLYAENVHADSLEIGTINTSMAWTSSGSPYTLTGNVFIENGATLTIQPGVTVNLESYQIQVYGVLNAQGQNGNPIVFQGNSGNSASITFNTASSGSTISYANIYSVSISITQGSPTISNNYFSGTQTSPIITINNNQFSTTAITGNSLNVASTDGIDVESGSASITGNLIVGQDYTGVYGIYTAASTSVAISSNNITHCFSGIWTLGSSSIEQNNIMNNDNDGVCSGPNSVSTIEYNAIADNICGVSGSGTIEDNTITANSAGLWSPSGTIEYNNIFNNYNYTGGYTQNIHLTDSNNLYAANNWWGSTDIPTINQTIWDSKNDTIHLGTVTFEPALNAPNPNAPTVPSFISTPTPLPTSTPTSTPIYTTPSPTPYVEPTLFPTPIPTSPLLQQETPHAITGNLNNSNIDSILVIAIAFILAASIIVVLNIKFGRAKASQPTKRRKRKRKNAKAGSAKPPVQSSQG
jgi:hypothetical protein